MNEHRAENAAPECQGCLCVSEHDGDYGSSGHVGPCPPHTCWGERPEDVILCTHQDESGHCSLPYGHGGNHVIPPAKPEATS